MAIYGEVTPANLDKVVGVLCFLIGCYVFTTFVALRDLKRMRHASFVFGQELWESNCFRESVKSIVDRDGEHEARGGRANSILARVAAIEYNRARALCSLRSFTTVSPREAFGDWLKGLMDNHKIIAAFGDSKPSYERAPLLLMELITFLVGCALVHDSDEDEEFIYLAAFRQGFLATCKQGVRTFPSALRETIALCVAVLPAQWAVSYAFANLQAARDYRDALQRKVIRDGVAWVSLESRSLVDVHRAIHQSKAARRALVRFSKATVVEESIASLEAYIRDLTIQSDAIREAAQESIDRPDDCAFADDIDGDSSKNLPKGLLGRSMRASSDALGRVQRTLSGNHEVLTTQRRRKAREKRLVLLGSLPQEAIHAFVYENRMVNALPFWWQRLAYTVFLRQNQVPTLPDNRSNATHPAFVSFFTRFHGIILCVVYCLLASSFVIAFHLRQNSQHDRSQNANVSVIVIANTLIEVMVVTPLFLLVRLAIVPTMTKLMLRRELGTALQELENSSRQPRSGTVDSAFGPTAMGVNKAKIKFLGLLGNRSLNDAEIRPADDDNIELSEVYPASTNTRSLESGSIELSESTAVSMKQCDVNDGGPVTLPEVAAQAEGERGSRDSEDPTVLSTANPMHRASEEI